MVTAMDLETAKDRAARVAEHCLGASNMDALQEVALDILNDYVAEFMLVDARQLAWALTRTERRDDLEAHERKLLELAWEKVREDTIQREWELLGG